MTDVHYVLGIPVPKPTCPSVEKIFHDFAQEIVALYGDSIYHEGSMVSTIENKFVDKIRVQATEPLRKALNIALERLQKAEADLEIVKKQNLRLLARKINFGTSYRLRGVEKE